ncbi:MAG: hypothetical protein RO257_09485 [Candidatus Kapabacteria bacterium]|nr:hypothetical protein [Candidatus Kapabacteria bacterium]
MSVLKVLAVALGLMFTITVANSFACDKQKTSAKSECSTEMKKTANAETSKSECSTTKKISAKADCCPSTKTASTKSECSTAKKNTKLEAKNNESNAVKTVEVKPINN